MAALARIHYLQWGQGEPGPADELFSDANLGREPDTLDRDTFDDLYQEVAADIDVDDAADLETVWAEWNTGSQQESIQYLEARYCERCDGYIEGSEEAVTHAVQNHGYDPDDPTARGEPEYVRGVRSMSVGDIVQIDDAYFMAASPAGWTEVAIGEVDE